MSNTGIRAEAMRFCDEPDDYFGNSESAMQAMPRDDVTALQREALRFRFETLRDRIPVLQKLADKQGIDALDDFDDAVPLLFEHTMYKSYPPALLERSRFADINKFLSRLSIHDLSGVDVSACKTIDDWLEVMDNESELQLALTSGTTGVMSFVPMVKREWIKRIKQMAALPRERAKDPNSEIYCVFPYFRSGIGPMRMNDWTVKYVVGDEDHFIAAYPGRLSADVMYLAARIRAAKAKGKLDTLTVNPALGERLEEFNELQANMPRHLSEFFERVVKQLRGKRVYFAGTWNMLHGLATQGLAKGEEGIFAADSYIQSGGGAKGLTPPENWQDDVCRFMGIDRLHMAYGMMEVATLHYQCEFDRYHFSPVAIPYVLDPVTSKPLPRHGRVTGRAAFFDLSAESRWGGFISGDEITVNWDDFCPCGRQSHFIEGTIERYSEKQGGDDKITCAATESAHREAMDYLTSVGAES